MQQDKSEILRKVRKIEIKARGLSQQLFSGEYHSAYKGRGMAFSEVREYQYGDDVRAIDWNVTARLNHPYIKVFEEERELTMMLLIDVSGSNRFGTHRQFKDELVAEVAATLAFSAITNNDKVGVIFFSDIIEKFIPPKKGSTHILRIISEILTFEPKGKGTDIAQALRYFTNVSRKRSTAFLLSDLFDSNYDDALKIAAKKHDLAVLHIVDEREQELPNIGLTKFYDPEDGTTITIDTSSAEVRRQYRMAHLQHSAQTEEHLQRYGIDHVDILTGEDFAKPLMALFKMRS